jgi:hypothetical protein
MHHSNPPDHALHELTLIAGHAAGDLSDSERIRADALLRSCTACADLQRDLVAITAATRALPAMAVAPRDFRLAPDQAARLRRGSWLRGLLRPFGAAQSAVRPMAAAFTSLGVAGLLVASILPGMLGSAASAPAPEQALSGAGLPAASAAAQPAAVGQTAGAGGQLDAAGHSSPPARDYVTQVKGGGSATSAPGDVGFGAVASQVPAPARTSAEDSSRALSRSPNPAVVGSFALLGIGLALFGLRFAARRVR